VKETPEGGDEPVPRISRGRGLRLRTSDVVRIGLFGTLLAFVVVMGRPCADGMAGFVESFSPPPDAAPAPAPLQLERLTEDEIRRRFPGDPDAGPASRDGADRAPRPASGPE
jgi:hypothetical protein